MTDEIDSLLQRYVDDRDALTPDELAEFTEHLRQSATLRERLRDQLVMHELICQRLAVDRGNFPAQVEQRLRDLNGAGDLASEVEAQVQGMQQLASEEWDHWAEKRDVGKRRLRRVLLGLAAAAAIALVCGYLGFESYGPVARLQSVEGPVMLVRDGKQVAARPEMWIYGGDKLTTTLGAAWELRYHTDGSLLSGRGDGDIAFVGGRRDSKQIVLNYGDVTADAKPQPTGKPMRFLSPQGEAVVVGTKLHFLATSDVSRLDVEHGKVLLRRLTGDGSEQLIETGRFGRISDDQLATGVTLWPMERFGLVVDGRFDNTANMQLRLTRPVEAELIPRGDVQARPGRLQLDGGAYQLSPFAADAVVERCQAANAVSVELWLRPDKDFKPERSTLLACGPEDQPNLEIWAEDDAILMRLATGNGESSQQKPVRLGALPAGRWSHLAVAYGNGRLICYVDGRQTLSRTWPGDLSTWSPGYFMIGDAWRGDGSQAWTGEIGALAVYERPLSIHEAFRNWRRLQTATQP